VVLGRNVPVRILHRAKHVQAPGRALLEIWRAAALELPISLRRASWLAIYDLVRLLLDLDGRKWPPALGPGNGALRFQCTAKLVANGGIVGEHYTPPLDERTACLLRNPRPCLRERRRRDGPVRARRIEPRDRRRRSRCNQRGKRAGQTRRGCLRRAEMIDGGELPPLVKVPVLTNAMQPCAVGGAHSVSRLSRRN